MPELTPPLVLLVGVVALLYASVGHGGGSGYLAVLSLYGAQPGFMSSTALTLNLIVASISAIAYIRAGYFSWSLFWPFVLTSIPCAFAGGLLHVEKSVYFLLLAFTLVFVSLRLFRPSEENFALKRDFTLGTGLLSGAVIGFVSGIVGIGGGIFLTPLIVLAGWSDTKRAAAVSALFIVVNSAAGLLARQTSGRLEFDLFSPLILAAALGGLLGGYGGANRLSPLLLRRTLAIVLLIAAFKLILNSN